MVLYLSNTPLHGARMTTTHQTNPERKIPFKKTRTFKALVLCVYVYSCIQLDPFDMPVNIHIGSEVQAEEQDKNKIIAEKLTELILAIFNQ